MINVSCVKQYCKNYEEIENYAQAIADTTQVWECHHILEEYFTRKMLIKGGNYYNVDPECLIFLTPAEHNKLHKTGNSYNPKRYIRCIETGEVHYDSEWRKLGYTTAYKVASGKLKANKGLHFEYLE